MKIISAKKDFVVENGVVMSPLKDKVSDVTGYDPQAPFESLGLDLEKKQIYDDKEAIAKKAELLESRITSTISSLMTKEEREMTMPDRYDKLVQAIKDYHNSDEAIRVYVTQTMNRAIRSMNSEFASVDARIVKDFEKEIHDKMNNVQELSSTAHKELIDLFDDYKKLDPSVQKSVLPEVKDLYKSYVSSNIDDQDVKNEVMRAYYAIPKTFNPKISFDLSMLYAEQKELDGTISIRETIDAANVSKMSYGDLVSMVERFQNYNTETKAELYGAYASLIDDYREAHPKSTSADELRLAFREQYYELVRSESTQDVVDSCRLINATTTAASRDTNVGLVNEVLEEYAKLPESSKTLVRPVVIDSIEEFNSYELKPVTAPTYRKEKAEESSINGKYSADYYSVRDKINNPQSNVDEVIREALELELKEQAQLLTLASVKNSHAYSDVLSEQVLGAKTLQSIKTDDWNEDIAKMFVALTPSNRDHVFESVVSNFPQTETYRLCADAVPGFEDAIEQSFRNHLELAESHSINKYNATIQAISVLPNNVQETLSEDTLNYFCSFVDSHKSLTDKAAVSYTAYMETSGSDAVKETVDDFNQAREVALKENEYEKLVSKTENGFSNIIVSGKVDNAEKLIEQYLSLQSRDQLSMYSIAREAVAYGKVDSTKFEESTNGDAFAGVKFKYEVERMNTSGASREDVLGLIENYSKLSNDQKMDQAELLNRFYVSYMSEHPRIAADSNVKEAYFAELKESSRLAVCYANSFNDTIKSEEVLTAAFVNKKMVEFDHLPMECKISTYPVVAKMYFDYADQRKVSPSVSSRFEEVTNNFAQQAIESGQCREQLYKNAERIITSNRTVEEYDAFIKDCAMKSVDNGGVQIIPKMRSEVAFMNVCDMIEKDVRDRLNHQNDIENFKLECRALSDGIDLRQRISGTRNIDQLEKTVAEFQRESVDVHEYAANAYVGKIDKFYNSSVSNEHFYISSFVTDQDGSNRKIFMEIEKVVGPNCVIAKAPNSDEPYLILTEEKIDIGVSRDEKDIYSALSGNRIIKANDNFNDNVMFSFDRSGKMVMTIPTPEAGILDDNYIPANYAMRQTYEVRNVERDGINTVISATNTLSDDNVEIVTRLKENDIVKRTRTDAIVGDTGSIAFMQGDNVMLSSLNGAIEIHREAVKGTRVEMGLVSEPVESENVLNISDGRYAYQNGKLFVSIDGKDYEIDSMKTIAGNDTLINYRDTEDINVRGCAVADDSYKTIVDKAFIEAVNKAETIGNDYSDMAITTYKGEVCVKYIDNGTAEFAPIYDLRNVDGKAVVDILDRDGAIRTWQSDMSYEDAGRAFASMFSRSCYVPELDVSNNDIRFEKEDGRVRAIISNELGNIGEGVVMTASSNGVYINTKDGPYMLTGVDDVANLIKSGSGVSTSVYTNDGKVTIVSGNGADYSDVLHPVHEENGIKKVALHEYQKDEFLSRGFSEGHRGSDVYMSWEGENGRLQSDKVVYMNASYSPASNKVDLVVVTGREDAINGFYISDFTVDEFRKVVEQVKIEDHAKDNFETMISLQNLNAGTYNKTDVVSVVECFNSVVGKSIEVSEVKPIQEPGDIARAYIVEKDDSYVLRGVDIDGKSISIKDPVLKFENDEMYVYSASDDRNRIASSAFGSYTSLVSLAAEQSFNYRLVLDGKEDLNHIISGVEIVKKVEWGLNENASSIRDLCVETLGLTCNANDGHKLGAGQLALGEDSKLSSRYGVIVVEDQTGPRFTYCNPSEDSNINFLPTLQANNKFLPSDEIPASHEDAKKHNFVLIDYDLGVAIKDGGMVYRMKLSDIPRDHDTNFYDSKIIDEASKLTQNARFVSASNFDFGSVDYLPSVNNWEINTSSSGRPILSFSEADFHQSLRDLSNTYEVSKIRISEDGKTVEAELVTPIASAENTSGKISAVRLCAPSEEQIQTIESATVHTIGSANEKVQHYFSQVNELASGYILHGEFDKPKLEMGQYLIVKNNADDKFGVMYKVCGDGGEMLIVGGSDESAKHPIMYTGINQLAGKDVTLIDLPNTVDQDMRWAKSTVYISDLKADQGRVSFSYGQMDLLNDTVGGPSCNCRGEKLSSRETVSEKEREFNEKAVSAGFDFD